MRQREGDKAAHGPLCPGAGRARSALTGFAAIYSGMSSHERELVLINILRAPRPVEIAAGWSFRRNERAS